MILMSRKMYPFDTRLESMAAEDTVEYPYASGNHAWNGNKALLIHRPTDISTMETIRGIVYSPFAASRATDSLMLLIRR